MHKINKNQYGTVLHLIQRDNDISPFSVLNGENHGEVYVNCIENPSSVLIKTIEVCYLAGDTADEKFNVEISNIIDFWEHTTPDSEDWRDMIPKVHANKFIREYTRRKYCLTKDNFKQSHVVLPEGYYLEQLNIKKLKDKKYTNSNKLIEWAQGWGSEEEFPDAGYGFYVRNNDTIVSWSLSDCKYKKSIEIGVVSDPMFRRQGFSEFATSNLINFCFNLGYENIHWRCVDTNKGSIAIAEKLGFHLHTKYKSFTSYAPIENLTDLANSGWYEWASYLDKASQQEPKLFWECLRCYIKADAVDEAIRILNQMLKTGMPIYLDALKANIQYPLDNGFITSFKNQKWQDYCIQLEERIKSGN